MSEMSIKFRGLVMVAPDKLIDHSHGSRYNVRTYTFDTGKDKKQSCFSQWYASNLTDDVCRPIMTIILLLLERHMVRCYRFAVA